MRPLSIPAAGPLAFLLLFSLAGCVDDQTRQVRGPIVDTLPGGIVRVRNQAPTAWADTNHLASEPDLEIGGDDTTAGLEQPTTLAVDGSGRVYVVDRVIKLFDSTGKFVRTVGRLGEGPGEYRGPEIATAGDRLLVQDATLARLSIFDSAGRFVTSWTTVCCAPTPPMQDAAGRIIVWTPSATQDFTWTRFDSAGRLLDTLRLPPQPSRALWKLHTGFGFWSAPVPYSPRTRTALLPAGGLVYGWSAAYTLTVTATGTDTVMLVEREVATTPLAEAQRLAGVKDVTDFLDRNGRNIGGVDPAEVARVVTLESVPTTAPAFGFLVADPAGRLWVSRPAGEDSTRSHFDLYAADGRYLGAVRAPVVLEEPGRSAWGRDAVYTIQETAAGLPVIVRYRLGIEVRSGR